MKSDVSSVGVGACEKGVAAAVSRPAAHGRAAELHLLAGAIPLEVFQHHHVRPRGSEGASRNGDRLARRKVSGRTDRHRQRKGEVGQSELRQYAKERNSLVTGASKEWWKHRVGPQEGVSVSKKREVRSATGDASTARRIDHVHPIRDSSLAARCPIGSDERQNTRAGRQAPDLTRRACRKFAKGACAS